MKKSYKQLLVAFIGFIIGTILTGSFLYQFIDSQKNQGYNTGYLDGGFSIITFLDKNIQNNLDSQITDLEVYHRHKYVGISVVEINGVKTIQISGMDH